MKRSSASKKTEKKPKKIVGGSTVNAAEIRQFDALGDKWWDLQGPMKPLHRLNPVRLEYIRRQAAQHFGRSPEALKILDGLDVADIGCGGGLLTEPLCRMGANVTGVDAGVENIRVAKNHAKIHGLDIDYQATTVEELARAKKKYDVVTALEIIEHVEDTRLFVRSCSELVKKGGMMVFSTLNRTPKSFLLGIVAAEHLLRWVPVGTHDWKKFVKPSELSRLFDENGVDVIDICGLVYTPLTQRFALDAADLKVNYLIVGRKR